MLVDEIGYDVFGFRFKGDRFDKPAVHQSQHLRLQRGAEKHGLAFACRRKFGDDAADIGDESHVQHTVRFINHENFRGRKIKMSAARIVNDPAGSPDENVDRIGKRVTLSLMIHAAEDYEIVQRRVFTECKRVIMNLDRELTGGGKHQHTAGAGAS